MKVLITGFDPFGGEGINSDLEAVKNYLILFQVLK